jgi:hypothetical protein
MVENRTKLFIIRGLVDVVSPMKVLARCLLLRKAKESESLK